MLVHASDNRVTIGVNYQRRDLRSSPMQRRNPGNIWDTKYPELSAIHNPAEVLTEKYFSNDLQPMRDQETGQREAREGLFLLGL